MRRKEKRKKTMNGKISFFVKCFRRKNESPLIQTVYDSMEMKVSLILVPRGQMQVRQRVTFLQ